jgi:hypothetical protein
MPALPPSAIPPDEKRLQSANTHRQFVENGAYPETRKMLMQQHASRAAKYEYLKPGANQQAFNFESGKRVHSVYDAVAKEAATKESTVRMVRAHPPRVLIILIPLLFFNSRYAMTTRALRRTQVMMDGRWRMMSN